MRTDELIPRQRGAESMRKLVGQLDDKERAVLRQFADFGTAIFSSALAITLLKRMVSLFI